MTAVYVPLPPPAHEALTRLAWRELRDPRLQARLLVEEGLRRAGVLVLDPPNGADDDPPYSMVGKPVETLA